MGLDVWLQSGQSVARAIADTQKVITYSQRFSEIRYRQAQGLDLEDVFSEKPTEQLRAKRRRLAKSRVVDTSGRRAKPENDAACP